MNYPVDNNLLDLWRTMLEDASQYEHYVRKKSGQMLSSEFADQSDKQVGVDMDPNSSLNLEFDTTDDEFTEVGEIF